VSSETPVQLVPSFDHFVTQWMSTVNVSDGSARTRSQVHERGSTAPVDREAPLLERRVRRRAGREHREVVDDVLAGRDPRRVDVAAGAAAEAT
jgi:hypothetical protein